MDYFVFILLCCWVFIDLHGFITRIKSLNSSVLNIPEDAEEPDDFSTLLYGWMMVVFIIVGISSSRYFYMLISGVLMFLMGDLFAKYSDKHPNRKRLLLWLDFIITMCLAATCFILFYNDLLT